MQTPSVPSGRLGVWRLAWPAVVANLLQATVGLVDVKAIATLGASSVAAATLGHRAFFLLQALLAAVTVGSSALVARAWGARRYEEAGRMLTSSLQLGAAISLALSVLGVLGAEAFASLFALTGEAHELAVVYMRWLSAGNVVVGVGFVLLAGVRAVGDTRTPLAIGALANVANVFFLYLFVYGGLGFPRLGISGAALAGGLAFLVSTSLALYLWLGRRLLVVPAPNDGNHRERLRLLVQVGHPAALEQLVVQGGFIAFTGVLARYGTPALAAYGIGVQILSISFVVGFGFSIAASTLVGQHLGAGDPEGARRSALRAMRLALLSMSVLSVLIASLAEPIAYAMIDDPEVVRLTVSFIYILALAQPLMAIDFALGGSLRGAGDTRSPLLATFTGLILGRVALATLCIAWELPIEWAYATLLADYVLKAILLVLRFRSGKWITALEPAGEPAPKPAVAA